MQWRAEQDAWEDQSIKRANAPDLKQFKQNERPIKNWRDHQKNATRFKKMNLFFKHEKIKNDGDS